MKMKMLNAAVCAALLAGMTTVCMAEGTVEKATQATENTVDKAIDKMPPKRTMPRAEYASEKDKIEADYKAAMASCKQQTGNAEKVCKAQAKYDKSSNVADLDASYKGTPKADYDAKVTKIKAQYDVNKQKCEDKTGSEKSACKDEAKADEDKALAEAKAKKVASSN
jgi:hypothetical protein